MVCIARLLKKFRTCLRLRHALRINSSTSPASAMKLEELRFDDLGKVCAWFPKLNQDTSKIVPITYHEHSIKAFYLTCQAIERLEKSKEIIDQGNTSLMASGMWFIAIEAFINSLLRIACRITNEDFAQHKTHDLNNRLRQLSQQLKIDLKPLYTSGIFQRLEEFKTYRNEIFHDRTWEHDLVFHKTKFASTPYLANQVDSVQASIIALEIFHAFRHVFKGLDLLPDIFIQKEDSFGYIKYDILYERLMRPFFLESLKKHSLKTDLLLNPTLIELDVSTICAAGDISIIVKAIQDEQFKAIPNKDNTTIGADLFNDAVKKLHFDPIKDFQVPSYIQRAASA